MKGPCLCGDPACPFCGDPEAARIEAAEDALLKELADLRLSAEEYALVLEVAKPFIEAYRRATKTMNDQMVSEMGNPREAKARAALAKLEILRSEEVSSFHDQHHGCDVDYELCHSCAATGDPLVHYPGCTVELIDAAIQALKEALD